MKRILLCLLMMMLTIPTHASGSVNDDQQLLSNSEEKIIETRLNSHDSIISIYSIYEEEVDIENYHTMNDEVVLLLNMYDQSIDIQGYGSYNTYPCEDIKQIAQNKLNQDGYYEALQSSIVNIERVYDGLALNESNLYHERIIDEPAYLNEDEEATLISLLETINEIDVAIYIESYNDDTRENRANDIYDYGFYGYGKEDSGILLYISQEPREYHLTTYGNARYDLDPYLDQISDKVVTYLRNDDYYQACSIYIESVKDLLANDTSAFYPPEHDDEYYYDEDYEEEKPVVLFVGIAFVISLVIATVATFIRQGKMNTAKKNDDANQYLEKTNMDALVCRDVFLYSNISKTPKPKDNDSSSGGGSSSSSGRSHGGSGGSY